MSCASILDLSTSTIRVAKANTTTPVQIQAGEYLVRTDGTPVLLGEGGTKIARTENSSGWLVDDRSVAFYTSTGTLSVVNDAGVPVQLFFARRHRR